MRLSKDDENNGYAKESSSISTQKKMLRKYADDNGFTVYGEYSDDGYSGTNFDRPAFRKMIQDIENKNIDVVITKDLSRLGREYIATGQYTEIYFPSKGVRYIAINDGYDSDSQFTDIAPFKNVINEMYARDISKKIRSAFTTKMYDGAFIGSFAPFGYSKDPDNKNHLIINSETAPAVKEIYSLAAKGVKPSAIANEMNLRGYETPSGYREKTEGKAGTEKVSKSWSASSVSKILKNDVYTGRLSQGKSERVSFKTKLSVQKPKDKWITAENTHEAIITKDEYDFVQEVRSSKLPAKKTEFINIFSGIAKCADCGKNMSSTKSRKKNSPYNLACGNYKLNGKKACGNHFIEYKDILSVTQKSLSKYLKLTVSEKEEIADKIYKEKNKDFYCHNRQENLKKRMKEIDTIIAALYEDKIKGTINEERFLKLSDQYEVEAQKIKNEETSFETEKLHEEELLIKIRSSIDSFIDTLDLDRGMLLKLIERIEIHQGSYINGIKNQKIKIYYNFTQPSDGIKK